MSCIHTLYHFLRIKSVLPLHCHLHPQDLARSLPELSDLADEGTTTLQNTATIYQSCCSMYPRRLESQDLISLLFAGDDKMYTENSTHTKKRYNQTLNYDGDIQFRKRFQHVRL